jgi:D-alanyl-D-alanine carboxypeptidase
VIRVGAYQSERGDEMTKFSILRHLTHPTGRVRGQTRTPDRLWCCALGLALVLFSGSLAIAQETDELPISARHYIVIDAGTGEIYAQRNAHEQVAPASLTKIFTAIQVIEEAPGGALITTTADDLVPTDATQVGFGPDEQFSVDDLIFGMMLPSGNDAARALARSLGAQAGDGAGQAVARFVERTNRRIADMGLNETNLVNPDGWGVPNHYSSAHDLAAFMMYALQYPRFTNAIRTSTYVTSNGYDLVTTNKMLESYDGLIGGKTGYDNDAGYCLIEVASRDGATMISVTLGAEASSLYTDHRVLLDYAFATRDERRAAGLGPMPEVVGFRDPDAAVISRVARPGASLSDRLAPSDSSGQGGIEPITSPPGQEPSVMVATEARSRRQILTALGVVAAVICGRTLLAFRRSGRVAATAVAAEPFDARSPGDVPVVTSGDSMAAPAEAASS